MISDFPIVRNNFSPFPLQEYKYQKVGCKRAKWNYYDFVLLNWHQSIKIKRRSEQRSHMKFWCHYNQYCCYYYYRTFCADLSVSVLSVSTTFCTFWTCCTSGHYIMHNIHLLKLSPTCFDAEHHPHLVNIRQLEQSSNTVPFTPQFVNISDKITHNMEAQ